MKTLTLVPCFKALTASALLMISYSAHSQIRRVVDGNNQFAFDFFTYASEKGKNTCVSPLSLYTVAAMLYEGARDTTSLQMRDVFYFGDDKTKLHDSFSRLLSSLDEPGLTDGLLISNGLWLQRNFPVSDTFQNVTTRQYNAELQLMDFVNDQEGSRKTINQWSAKSTEGLIPEILPAGAIKSNTRLVVTNAIFFARKWMDPFKVAETTADKFYINKQQTVTAKFMNKRSASCGYFSDDNVSVLTLDYEGMKYSMVVILPKGDVEDLELSNEVFQQWMNEVVNVNMLLVSIPKFKFEQTVPAKDILMKMGLTMPFAMDAEFGGITDAQDLFLSDVFHKTYISVDENGTTAAAVSAGVAELRSAPPKTSFVANKPFLFVLVDNDNNSIIFVGKVNDPTK